MTTISLKLGARQFEDLWDHLLQRGDDREQAAFLFARTVAHANRLDLDVLEVEKLNASDFEVQGTDYLELADATRARLIKRSHALKTMIVEAHSHPGPWPAAFSAADRDGLAETVPHMLWRLPNRPYAAIVVAESGFDALVWFKADDAPRPLSSLIAGERVMCPTNNSLDTGWSRRGR